jgi:molecular chaperone HscB
MICWSCERAAGAGPFCARCGAILPPDPAVDHFTVAGVARGYALDLAELEERFREQSRKLHPDRFTTADARARRASLQWSVKLNEARRVLKDPIKRAAYLLSLNGVQVPAMAPPALLMEILELREALGEARAAGDDQKIQAMASAMRARLGEALRAVAEELGAARFERAAAQLVAIRYFARFMDEVGAHDEALAERAPSSGADARAGGG